ncbi:oligosaccharide flippase family protein [Pengzhenrongella sicca]|uniref:Oligosaccharide flippase family protein n=1 Tax=Pengzhenrongella sicca TaxID=2819238 RepID=A0A8A4ZD04_9MICO|nr:oligosaccharide flippase family protein [Pengzhenrongella sicca]QTE28899.1 oligosaccharide flippase family protein [Pengzhenrongella sicca]
MRVQFLVILVSRGIGSLLQAAVLILLARAVPASVFGLVNAVIGIVGLVLVVTGLGMSTYVPRARALGRSADVAAALRLNTISNVVTGLALAGAIVAWTSWGGLPVGLAIIGASLALERNVDTLLGVPIADGDSRTPAVSMLLRRSVSLAALLAGMWAGLEPLWAYGAGLLLGAVAGQLHVRHVLDVDRTTGRSPTPDVLRQAWPFLVSNVTAQARTLDTAIVAATLSAASAGLYAAAAKLVQPLLLIPQTVGAVVTPHAARLEPRAARRLGLRLSAVFCASLAPIVPLMLVAEPLVVFVMGDAYAGAGPALAWSLAGLPFMALAASLGGLLQGQGAERLVAVNGTVFGLLMIPAIAAGAASAGIGGAAAGLGLSYLLRSAVLVRAVARLGSVR